MHLAPYRKLALKWHPDKVRLQCNATAPPLLGKQNGLPACGGLAVHAGRRPHMGLAGMHCMQCGLKLFGRLLRPCPG